MFAYDVTEKILVGYKKEIYIDYDIRSNLLEKIFKSLEKFFNNLSYRVYKLNKLINRKEVEKEKQIPVYDYVEIKINKYDYLSA